MIDFDVLQDSADKNLAEINRIELDILACLKARDPIDLYDSNTPRNRYISEQKLRQQGLIERQVELNEQIAARDMAEAA